jgi:hypothetical protein
MLLFAGSEAGLRNMEAFIGASGTAFLGEVIKNSEKV